MYRPAAAVAHVVDSNADNAIVYVAPLPNGPILALEGSAAVIWAVAVEGPGDDLATAVAERSGADPDEIRDDVEAFVIELMQRGLLERIS